MVKRFLDAARGICMEIGRLGLEVMDDVMGAKRGLVVFRCCEAAGRYTSGPDDG